MTSPDYRVVLDQQGVESAVARLAAELSEKYHDGVVLAAVLRGSVPFLSDLSRAMSIRSVVDFLAITKYERGTGRVRLLKDLDIDITDREVVIVEDIVDTGLTSGFLWGEFSRRSPRSLSICTFVDRPSARMVPVQLDHIGVEIPDEFVVGYGLDYHGRYRNLRMLASVDVDVLASDPDAYVEALYVS